jgi:hypothetical protein
MAITNVDTTHSVSNISNPPTRIALETNTISASATLTKGDSGEVFFLSGAVGGTVTMPAPFAGGRVKFVMTENDPTTAFTIDCGAGLLMGNLQNASGHARANNDQNVVFGTTSVKGDFADFCSDGTNWYVAATTAISGAITFS